MAVVAKFSVYALSLMEGRGHIPTDEAGTLREVFLLQARGQAPDSRSLLVATERDAVRRVVKHGPHYADVYALQQLLSPLGVLALGAPGADD